MSVDPPLSVAERFRRGDVFEPRCPSRDVLRHMTSMWGALTLIALKDGTLRFSEVRRKVAGVSERMLSQTLKQLEGDGLVLRESYAVVPPRVEYSLTPHGQQAAALVETMVDWVEANVAELRHERE